MEAACGTRRFARRTTFSLRSPDSLLDRAVEYAKVNLDESFVCNPDLGCGLVAGYGLSGAASDRPGFGWFFGGDAAINSFAMSAACLLYTSDAADERSSV